MIELNFLPNNLFFLLINFSFLSFSLLASFILYKVFRSKLVFLGAFFGVLYFAYGDLFTSYALKQYYKTFEKDNYVFMESKKNENGKIESIDLSNVVIRNINMPELYLQDEKELISFYEKFVDEFIEITLLEKRYGKKFYTKKRIYLNIYKYDKSFIKDLYKEARYKINISDEKKLLTKDVHISYYNFYDNVNKVDIAKAFNLNFLNSNEFRDSYLQWNNSDFRIKEYSNYEILFTKLFMK